MSVTNRRSRLPRRHRPGHWPSRCTGSGWSDVVPLHTNRPIHTL